MKKPKPKQLEDTGPIKGELNDMQKRFCEEFLIDLNGTKAAIRAGYSKKSAGSQASRLLTDAKISQYILELIEKRSEETGIKASDVLKELAKVAFSNLKKVADWDEDGNLRVRPSNEMTLDEAAAIESIKMTRVTRDNEMIHTTLSIKLHRKTPALMLLMRHLGMLGDKEDDENPILKKAMAEIERGR